MLEKKSAGPSAIFKNNAAHQYPRRPPPRDSSRKPLSLAKNRGKLSQILLKSFVAPEFSSSYIETFGKFAFESTSCNAANILIVLVKY